MEVPDWRQDPATKVELRQAAAWMCPRCAQTIYVELEERGFGSEEEEKEARAAFGLDDFHDADVSLLATPLYVWHCGEKFRAIAGGLGVSEDELT